MKKQVSLQANLNLVKYGLLFLHDEMSKIITTNVSNILFRYTDSASEL